MTSSTMNRESNRLELKRELNDRFERSVVAFLNYPGGGENLTKNNIRPATLGLFDVLREQRNGREIIRVVVSGGQQRPYYLRAKGMNETGCFIRVGNTVQPMTGQMVEDLISKRRPALLQTTPSPRKNLTFEQLKIYYQEHGFEINAEFLGNLELLAPSGEYNFAAYLLADSNGVSMKVAKYAGTDKYDLVENYEYGNCCLLTATHRVLERLLVENKTFAKIAYPTRIEKSQVDKTALREAVINAIVHNDYNLTVPLVEIYSNRIVVTSAGGLVEGLSREDFFNCRSMPRNRVLMRIFRDMDLVESLGSGMTRILRAYDPAIFNFTPSFMEVVFLFETNGTDEINNVPVKTEDVEANVGINVGIKPNGGINVPVNPENVTINSDNVLIKTDGGINGGINVPVNVGIKPSGGINVPVNPDDVLINSENVLINPEDVLINPEDVLINIPKHILVEKVRILIQGNPTVTIPKLANTLGVTDRTIRRVLKSLREAGVIKRVGSRKTGHWEVINN